VLTRPNPYLGAPRHMIEHDIAIIEQVSLIIDTCKSAVTDAKRGLECHHPELEDCVPSIEDMWSDTYAIVLAKAKEALGE
jgi:hypothetical protein